MFIVNIYKNMYKVKYVTKKILEKINYFLYMNYIRYFKKYLRLSSQPFISGDTFRSFARHKLDESSNVNSLNVKNNDILFIKGDFIEDFIKRDLNKLPDGVKVITHNSDVNITEEFVNVFKEKKISWFVQNASVDITKIENIHLIPIGFENRNWFSNGKLKNLKNVEIPNEKMEKIFIGFNTNTNKERVKILKVMDKNDLTLFFRRTTHKEYLKQLAQCKVSLCPEGNGVDTHRIWESLLVKTLPILLKTEFSLNLKTINVPMYLVDDWNEVNELTENQISDIYKNYAKSLNETNLIYSEYWHKIIINNK